MSRRRNASKKKATHMVDDSDEDSAMRDSSLENENEDEDEDFGYHDEDYHATDPSKKYVSCFAYSKDGGYVLTDHGKLVIHENHPSNEVKASLVAVGYDPENVSKIEYSPRPPHLPTDVDRSWWSSLPMQENVKHLDPLVYVWPSDRTDAPIIMYLSEAYPTLVSTGKEKEIFQSRECTESIAQAIINARGSSNNLPECIVEERLIINCDGYNCKHLEEYPGSLRRSAEFAYMCDMGYAPFSVWFQHGDRGGENFNSNDPPVILGIQVKRWRIAKITGTSNVSTCASLEYSHHYSSKTLVLQHIEYPNGMERYICQYGDETERMMRENKFGFSSQITAEQLKDLRTAGKVVTINQIDVSSKTPQEVIVFLRNQWEVMDELQGREHGRVRFFNWDQLTMTSSNSKGQHSARQAKGRFMVQVVEPLSEYIGYTQSAVPQGPDGIIEIAQGNDEQDLELFPYKALLSGSPERLPGFDSFIQTKYGDTGPGRYLHRFNAKIMEEKSTGRTGLQYYRKCQFWPSSGIYDATYADTVLLLNQVNDANQWTTNLRDFSIIPMNEFGAARNVLKVAGWVCDCCGEVDPDHLCCDERCGQLSPVRYPNPTRSLVIPNNLATIDARDPDGFYNLDAQGNIPYHAVIKKMTRFPVWRWTMRFFVKLSGKQGDDVDDDSLMKAFDAICYACGVKVAVAEGMEGIEGVKGVEDDDENDNEDVLEDILGGGTDTPAAIDDDVDDDDE